MKTSDELFRLIKSLDKNEKRYFKLHASLQSGEKNYLKIFNAIEKQKVYDEGRILKLFSGSDSIRHFSVAKNYLFHLLLKSLRVYNSSGSLDLVLREMTDNMEILCAKGQYKACTKIIAKAKKLAFKFERYRALPEILSWERRILFLDKTLPFAAIKKNAEESDEVLKNLEITQKYADLSFKLWSLFTVQGRWRNSKEQKEFNTIYADPLLKDESRAITIQSKMNFYDAHVFYNRVNGNFKNAYIYCQKALHTLETSGELIDGAMLRHINTHYNFILILLELSMWSECKAMIKKLRALASHKDAINDANFVAKIVMFSHISELFLYNCIDEYTKGTANIQVIEDDLLRYKNKINNSDELLIYYLVALLYFGAKEYRKSLFWLNKYLNDATARENSITFARIFNLILHYELGNSMVLEHITRSTYRLLRKKQKLHKGETFILSFFKKLPDSTNEEELLSAFEKLEDQLTGLREDPYEKNTYEDFDILSWLRSKIENKDYSEIVKENKTKRFKGMDTNKDN